ncbi:SDR family oxidoreductase [Gordonia alkanivorans]|uniref:Putative oxidoreductase n=1 Tax=Gordonia alkanivorans NBRC 16433 TaxID=1027371 RepID=F9W1Z4_9ACTN|nr:SDR family oxidoreductase [Gordonia alkanivorans]GAA14912.1 putative oxidoreductase [Gordonia alkanivorans NBRC 16433]
MPSVLITGAGRGIGRAIAQRLVSEGWTVFAGVRDEGSAPPGTSPVILDVTDPQHLADLPGALPESLDALVNNAGIVVSGPVEGLSPQDLRSQFDVNVLGLVAVTAAVLPLLRAATGRIVHIGSLSGRISTPMTGAYNASKYAVEALADAQRIELRPWGISVSVVEPGPVDTDIWRDAPSTLARAAKSLARSTQDLYSPHIGGMRRTIRFVQRSTVSSETIAEKVATVLAARRPRARYPVGRGARLQLVATSVTPTWLLDRVLAAGTGIPARIP